MITSYVYMNHYRNDFLYVGCHSCDDSILVNGVDPSYQGSSFVANHYGWSPVRVEVLQSNIPLSLRYRVESQWIDTMALRYGIADCATELTAHNVWITQYTPHGKLLNLHNNMCSTPTNVAALKCVINGKTDSQLAANRSNAAVARGNRTHESFIKGSQSHDYSVRGLRTTCSPNNRNVLLNGVLYRGTLNACISLGHPGWACQVNRLFAKGLTKVIHHGHVFMLVS